MEKELLQSEIEILKIIDHPGVIKINEVFDSKKYILIVMEFVEGGELFERIVKKKFFLSTLQAKLLNSCLNRWLICMN